MRIAIRTLQLSAAVVALVLLASSRPIAQTPAVRIDALMAAPFPTDLVAAPTGGGIAWVSSVSGVHNVSAAEAPDCRARAVTSYTGDDGLWITELTWTSDGKHLVYVRGDGANRQGESPNPAQLQDGTEQAVFVVDLAGGATAAIQGRDSRPRTPRNEATAGKFVETFVLILQHLETQKYSPKPDVDTYLKQLDDRAAPALGDDLRICAVRQARAMYTLRNKRNIAHKNDVDPNVYDQRVLYSQAQWILSELLRFVTGSTMTEAARLIAQDSTARATRPEGGGGDLGAAPTRISQLGSAGRNLR